MDISEILLRFINYAFLGFAIGYCLKILYFSVKERKKERKEKTNER